MWHTSRACSTCVAAEPIPKRQKFLGVIHMGAFLKRSRPVGFKVVVLFIFFFFGGGGVRVLGFRV